MLWYFVSGQGKGDKYEDKSLDLFQYFTSSCYTGFGDDDKVGFNDNNNNNNNDNVGSLQMLLFSIVFCLNTEHTWYNVVTYLV